MPPVSGRALGNLLHETTHVSWPLVPTVPIHTGPQAQEREGHFAANDCPALERLGTVTPTFWAGHRPLQGKFCRRLSLEEKEGTSDIPSFRGLAFHQARWCKENDHHRMRVEHTSLQSTNTATQARAAVRVWVDSGIL